MTGVLSTVALLALIGLGVWIFGSFALRLGGLLLFLLGLVGLLQGTPVALIVVAIGGVAWLAGHWLFAYKYQAFKSMIAQRLFQQTFLAVVDPTRGWGIPTVARCPVIALSGARCPDALIPFCWAPFSATYAG